VQAVARIIPLRISVNLFSPYQKVFSQPIIISRVRADSLIADARRLAPSTYADMFQWDALKVVGNISVPLLVLYGTYDQLQPSEQSKMLYEAARSQKELRAIPTSHVPNLENPELLAPLLTDWFERTL
jgi:pimeloyl-ACP methyl ester carboxylesterase